MQYVFNYHTSCVSFQYLRMPEHQYQPRILLVDHQTQRLVWVQVCPTCKY